MPGTRPGASCHWFSPLRGLRGRRWPSPVSGQDTHRGPERLDPLLKCQGCRSAIPAPRTPKPPLPAAGPALAGSRLGRPRQALSLLHLNRWQRHPAGSWGGGPCAGKRTDGHGAASLLSPAFSPNRPRGQVPSTVSAHGGKEGVLQGGRRRRSPWEAQEVVPAHEPGCTVGWGAPPRLPRDSAGCQEAAVLQSLTLGAL